MYDYGNANDNEAHYAQSTPTIYDMSSIPNDFPIYLSYGGMDELSDVQDVKTLLESIKDHDPDKLIVQYMEDYAHADFVFAVKAKEVVYNPVMIVDAFYGSGSNVVQLTPNNFKSKVYHYAD
ncbi:triacylglycerol lipase 2-like protein [Tanacetum coccineum]